MNTNFKKIILGTAQMGLNYGVNNKLGKVSFEESSKILIKSFNSGIDTLDTAEVYGTSHEVIGKFHQNHQSIKFKINTKLPYNTKLSQLDNKIKKYLDVLNVDQIETIMFHSYDSYNSNKDILNKLIEFKKNGFIKNIGVSVYKNIEVGELLKDEKITAVQLPFNLFDNNNLRGKTLLDLKKNNKLVQVRSIFLQGLFFKKINDDHKIVKNLKPEISFIKNILKENDCSIEELAIGYCFNQKNINNIILGVDSLDQLNKNLFACDFIISEKIKNQIHKIKIRNIDLLNPSLWN